MYIAHVKMAFHGFLLSKVDYCHIHQGLIAHNHVTTKGVWSQCNEQQDCASY